MLYAFGLCLENWSSGVALRIAEDKDDFVWVDVNQLNNVPKQIPASREYQDAWRKNVKGKKAKEPPQWMNLEVEEDVEDLEAEPTLDAQGMPVPAMKKEKKEATGQIMLDLHLTIGEGMPTNKVSMYNILLSLSQLTVIDEMTGQPAPLLTRGKVTKMLEDILGIVIEEDDEGITANGQRLATPSGQPSVPPINQDANVPNANASGRLAGGV